MVTDRQRKDLKRLMKRIKVAKDEDMDEEVVRRRTRDLAEYLDREGLRDMF